MRDYFASMHARARQRREKERAYIRQKRTNKKVRCAAWSIAELSRIVFEYMRAKRRGTVDRGDERAHVKTHKFN